MFPINRRIVVNQSYLKTKFANIFFAKWVYYTACCAVCYWKNHLIEIEIKWLNSIFRLKRSSNKWQCWFLEADNVPVSYILEKSCWQWFSFASFVIKTLKFSNLNELGLESVTLQSRTILNSQLTISMGNTSFWSVKYAIQRNRYSRMSILHPLRL